MYGRKAQIAQNMSQKILSREHGIINKSKRDAFLPECVKKASQHQGLSRTHFTRDDHESLLLQDPVTERRERLVMARCGIEKKRIRTELEWISSQPIKFSIHRDQPL